MPLRETAYQAYTFLALVYAGMLSSLLYDLLQPPLQARAWPLRLAADVFLCVCTAALCFAALALTGCAALRLYMALALLAGSAVYRLGVRRIMLAAIKTLRPNRSSAGHVE